MLNSGADDERSAATVFKRSDGAGGKSCFIVPDTQCTDVSLLRVIASRETGTNIRHASPFGRLTAAVHRALSPEKSKLPYKNAQELYYETQG
ncbi:hypothetical protein DN068_08610 [Taibaiella soli]|uniref:Uncharacterized protein n=1 Tax=Taibaiella soli TaxID=1649169 RepID=A0A2W2ADU2_9BACT|nr:hypothetical protein DN068_08610 [Taibaiella soli]